MRDTSLKWRSGITCYLPRTSWSLGIFLVGEGAGEGVEALLRLMRPSDKMRVSL